MNAPPQICVIYVIHPLLTRVELLLLLLVVCGCLLHACALTGYINIAYACMLMHASACARLTPLPSSFFALPETKLACPLHAPKGGGGLEDCCLPPLTPLSVCALTFQAGQPFSDAGGEIANCPTSLHVRQCPNLGSRIRRPTTPPATRRTATKSWSCTGRSLGRAAPSLAYSFPTWITTGISKPCQQ